LFLVYCFLFLVPYCTFPSFSLPPFAFYLLPFAFRPYLAFMIFTDQIARTVELGRLPKRIVSVVPSQTELLHDLGLEEEVTGITKFCIHPQTWFRSKKRVGGTKQLHIDTIRGLQPDLILANKEENVKEQIEELAKDFPVWTSDISNLGEALQMIRSVGELVGKEEKANTIASDIETAFASIKHLTANLKPQTSNLKPRCCYLIWKEPYITVGGDTFINDMLLRCGLENAFAAEKRYPQVTHEQIREAGCGVVLLSSEPYPFRRKHVEELGGLLGDDVKILLADGELFSWYGSRLLQSPAYFEGLLRQIHSIS
jgi:ABC-type Fe3+-hydroxamate transport system substrate-binding protein